MFLSSRFLLILASGAAPVATLTAIGFSPLLTAAIWASVCAVGATLDVGLAADARNLSVARRAPHQVLRKEPFELGLVVQNIGTRRLRAFVRDSWPHDARARFGVSRIAARSDSGSRWGRLQLASGERLRVPLTLTPKKSGELRSTSVVVRTLGPLGLAGRQVHHALPGSIRVISRPWLGWKRAQPVQHAGDPAATLNDALQGEDDGSLTNAVIELRDLAGVYGSRAHLKPGGSPHPVVEAVYRGISLAGQRTAPPDHSVGILALTEHLTDLFVRARLSGTEQQLRLLISRYRDTTTKLLRVLADDYYGDILRNPSYWSSPEARISEVQLAVESVDQQIIENIKQLNESRDLEFQVALDSLTRALHEAKLSDVYRASENE